MSLDSDQQVMSSIQSRFEVAVPELPDHIDPASYSECRVIVRGVTDADADIVCSDVVKRGRECAKALCCFLLWIRIVPSVG